MMHLLFKPDITGKTMSGHICPAFVEQWACPDKRDPELSVTFMK